MKLLAVLSTTLFIVYLFWQYKRPDLLLVGTITTDEVRRHPSHGFSKHTGGAVSYAAVVARALGLRTCIVTAATSGMLPHIPAVAGPDANLTVLGAPHSLHVVPANSTLTFEHTYNWFGKDRQLRVTANPGVTLSRAHVPRHCQRARVVLLGPLTAKELDAHSFLTHDGGPFGLLLRGHQLVGLMAQGFQRALVADYHDPEHMGSQDLPQDSHQLEGGQDGSPCAAQVTATHLHQAAQQHASGNHARLGKVVSLQHPSRHLLLGIGMNPSDGSSHKHKAGSKNRRGGSGAAHQQVARVPSPVSVFLSDVETGSWDVEDVARVATGSGTRGSGLLVTRGAKGVSEWDLNACRGVRTVPAVPVPRVADTNGAGDSFATGYMAGLLQGHPDPAEFGSYVASRVVMAPQSCKPDCAADALVAALIEASARARVGKLSTFMYKPLAWHTPPPNHHHLTFPAVDEHARITCAVEAVANGTCSSTMVGADGGMESASADEGLEAVYASSTSEVCASFAQQAQAAADQENPVDEALGAGGRPEDALAVHETLLGNLAWAVRWSPARRILFDARSMPTHLASVLLEAWEEVLEGAGGSWFAEVIVSMVSKGLSRTGEVVEAVFGPMLELLG